MSTAESEGETAIFFFLTFFSKPMRPALKSWLFIKENKFCLKQSKLNAAFNDGSL